MASPAALITEMESWEHLKNLTKMVGPYIVLLIGLLIYTWKQHEKSQDKLEKTLTDHILYDDKTHNDLYTHIRGHGESIAAHTEQVSSMTAADATHRQMFRSVADEMDELRGITADIKLNCAKTQHGGGK